MGLLDGLIKAEIYKGFKGKLLTGTLRRLAGSNSLNDLGDPATSTATTYPFEGFRETYDAAYRARAGIPQTDVKIVIIAGSISTVPLKDDEVYILSTWHKVRGIPDIDPAGATYTLQCYEIEEPQEEDTDDESDVLTLDGEPLTLDGEELTLGG